uniref:WRKY domain-containing protein n=1 Tax=Hordeum vulgare subsp. vulgare TaxID=112509 RepID=A0A8I6YGM9_HORVV
METPFAQVTDDLIKGRELATQLQGLLRDSPKSGLIMDRILHAFSRSIHAAKAAVATSERASSDVQSEVIDGVSGGGKRKPASAAAGGNRRACRRSRTQQSSVVFTKSIKSLDDGHAWRKYGQKEIHNSKHSRAYFRCTHKYDQLCAAQRQVQRCDDDEGMFRVTYIGVHTCRDPAAAVAPHVLHLTGTAEGMHAGCRLISFAPGGAAATTHDATASTTTNANLVDKDAATGSGRQGMKPESGDQEEVLSSRTPGNSAPRSTAPAATAPAWPDQGDVTSTRQYGGAVSFGEYLDDYTSLGDLASYVLDH